MLSLVLARCRSRVVSPNLIASCRLRPLAASLINNSYGRKQGRQIPPLPHASYAPARHSLTPRPRRRNQAGSDKVGHNKISRDAKRTLCCTRPLCCRYGSRLAGAQSSHNPIEGCEAFLHCPYFSSRNCYAARSQQSFLGDHGS